MEKKGKILVVDDEASIRDLLSFLLGKDGHEVHTAECAEEALSMLAGGSYDLVIEDIRLPGMDGIELLRRIKSEDPDALVAVITAYSDDWNIAVSTMRLGAFDYLKKPFDNDDVRQIVDRAVRIRNLYGDVRTRRTAQAFTEACRIVGDSPQMREVFEMVTRIARTDSTVLIEGESGTGKELVARALHYGSHRAHNPFIAVNCGAFTESLLESELFGHVKGAFTGAIADKKGLFEVANDGTLFLDEVADLAPATQVKLLRVLEEREFTPVGSHEVRKKLDIRVVCATNRHLADEVKKGTFREDLFYRINVIPIPIPPLRDRKEDIPLLAGHMLAFYSKTFKTSVKSISPKVLNALMQHDWPGNVRELQNVIQRAITLCDSTEITLGNLPESFRTQGGLPLQARITLPPGGTNLETHLAKIEQAYLLEALSTTGWNLTKAARLLGMTFRSTRYKVKKYGLKAGNKSL